VVVASPSTADALSAALAGESDRAAQVLLGGVPRTELSVRGTLAVSPHKVDIFAGSLRDNVILGSVLDDQRLADALEASACTELLELFPDGLDHQISADGMNLSGGQRQRIA